MGYCRRVPTLTPDDCRMRFSRAEHGYLATCGEDRWPHVVPVVFAVDGELVVVAVDDKPKRTTDLRRLRNVRQNPRVAFLVDVYDADWSRLWWVRADAMARVVEDGPERDDGLRLLAGRYEQYRAVSPSGPLVVADVERWSGWAASGRGR